MMELLTPFCRVQGLGPVGDLGHEAGVAVDGVGDALGAAGQDNEVGTLGVIAVTSLFSLVVVAGVVVIHGIVEVVPGRRLREERN